MTLPIQQVTREIRAIEAKTEALVAQLQPAYQEYLDRLGETVQRQLIAACYHLCTQQFPDVFLRLKYSDREKMQRSLQKLATETKHHLILGALGKRILENQDGEEGDEFSPSASEDFDLDSSGDVDFDLDSHDHQETEDDLPGERNSTRDDAEDHQDSDHQNTSDHGDHGEIDNRETPDHETHHSESTAVTRSPFSEAETASLADWSQPPSVTNPQVLVEWYSEIEETIAEVLRQASQQATKILERSGIIHNQLPEPLLEVATQSEAAENVSGNHPNILNLVVEMGKMSEEGRKSSTQRIEIVAVYLRLSDLEFSDTYLVSHRNKLRGYFQQLQSLSKVYQKRTREHAIAQAEAAWRSSWGI